MPFPTLLALRKHFLSLHGKSSVRYQTEPLLRDKLSGHTANTVSLVFDTYEGSLEILDELILTLG